MNILDKEVILALFTSYYPFFVVSVFLGAFVITYYLVPKVLWVSNEKNLSVAVNERSAHLRETPSFGGVAFFMTLVLVISVLQSVRVDHTGNHLIAAMTLLFMVGLKDDLVISTARVKLLGQITAALFVIFSPELQLSNLHGFLGFYEIPLMLGYLLKGFFMVALINAYNLIDGIDGLASIVGIVIGTAYAVVFHLTGHAYFVLISLSVVGILTAFLRFNFSRGRNKMFMGDSGSLIMGLILGFLSLKILAMQPYESFIDVGYMPENRILLVFAALFVPIFDTARVILLRLFIGSSPFEADRNHAHHVLLDLGYSHGKASLWLGGLNLLVLGFYWLLSSQLDSLWLSLSLFGVYMVVALMFGHLKLKSQERTQPGDRKYREWKT